MGRPKGAKNKSRRVDKFIERMRDEGKTPKDLSDEFFAGLKALIKDGDPRALFWLGDRLWPKLSAQYLPGTQQYKIAEIQLKQLQLTIGDPSSQLNPEGLSIGDPSSQLNLEGLSDKEVARIYDQHLGKT